MTAYMIYQMPPGPEIAEHKPRLQVLILELVPNSESIDLLS